MQLTPATMLRLVCLLCLLCLALPSGAAAKGVCHINSIPGGSWKDECSGLWKECDGAFQCKTFLMHCKFMFEGQYYEHDYEISCEKMKECNGKLMFTNGQVKCSWY